MFPRCFWIFPRLPENPRTVKPSPTRRLGDAGRRGSLPACMSLDDTRGGPFSDTGTRPFEHEECRDSQPDYSDSGLILAWPGWGGVIDVSGGGGTRHDSFKQAPTWTLGRWELFCAFPSAPCSTDVRAVGGERWADEAGEAAEGTLGPCAMAIVHASAFAVLICCAAPPLSPCPAEECRKSRVAKGCVHRWL